jgi:hypothetical protein
MDQRAQIAGVFDRAASTYDRVGVGDQQVRHTYGRC